MVRSAVLRSGLTRILTVVGVVGVVAGVFAMHGLTSNHDAVMPGMAVAQTNTSEPAGAAIALAKKIETAQTFEIETMQKLLVHYTGR